MDSETTHTSSVKTLTKSVPMIGPSPGKLERRLSGIMDSAGTTATTAVRGLEALNRMREARRAFQDENAETRDRWIESNQYFYGEIRKLLCFVVGNGKRVLDVRCLTGDTIAALQPARGVGVEIGQAMVNKARQKHPKLHFVQSDPESLDLREKFDCVIFNNIFDTVDVLAALERIREHCEDDGSLVIVNYSALWQPILSLASRIGLRAKFVEPNWVSADDICGFLKLAGFRLIRQHRLLLFPKWVPLLSYVANRVIAKLPGIRRLCMMQVIVARPLAKLVPAEDVSVSVVVPCRNEEANVAEAVERIPAMGRHTEIIFCDDKSTDGTGNEVRRMQALYPEKDIRLVSGPGICKAENVWTGFRAARGDVLMILDADLSVIPEELPIFLQTLLKGSGYFVNGSRLIYPMQKHAMKFANMVGNKVFGLIFSFLLDQRIKDTLCGTKALWRKDWYRLEPNIGRWGIRDLWGDYELLFGASKLDLEILEVPVHYQERIYGVTKMTRVFRNGVRMLGICWRAWLRLGG